VPQKPKNDAAQAAKPIEAPAATVSGGPPALDAAISQVKPHVGKILAVVALVALAAIGYASWRWYMGREAGKATFEFAAALNKAEAPIDTPPANAEPSDELTFPTARARAEAALVELESLEQKHGSSPVTEKSYLLKGSLLYDLARYDDAVTAYDRVLASRPPLAIAYLAHEGKGYAREAQGLASADAAAKKAALDKALASFKDIQTDPEGRFYDVSLYHQGRILALLGDAPGAIKAFKLALEKKPGFQLEDQLKSRLALLEQKTGGAMPTPVPAPK
jgi:tetratricopeptide (TPR) repeat protein